MKKIGLTIYIGQSNQKSKTEAMFFPARSTLRQWKINGSSYETADESKKMKVDKGGFIEFTQDFTFLGSIISYNLKD